MYSYIFAIASQTIQPSEPEAKIAINIAAFLSVLCWIFLLGFVITRFNQKMRDWYRDFFGNRVYLLAWLVPTVAMALSLYFSEFLGWAPCRLCWFQRACIYPLVLITLIYYLKHSPILRYIGYALAFICPFISIYHLYIEYKGAESAFCSAAVSCATIWFKSFGFLTTPGMALTASVTIFILLYMSSRLDKSPESSHQK